jgi:hypothetical protein
MLSVPAVVGEIGRGRCAFIELNELVVKIRQLFVNPGGVRIARGSGLLSLDPCTLSIILPFIRGHSGAPANQRELSIRLSFAAG